MNFYQIMYRRRDRTDYEWSPDAWWNNRPCAFRFLDEALQHVDGFSEDTCGMEFKIVHVIR